jgi:acyl-CoA reductase-like NAD-dependent aldehyde dehydrogenase
MFYLHPQTLLGLGPVSPVIDPATLQTIGSRTDVTLEQAAQALQTLTLAQQSWKRTDAKKRADVLHRIADTIQNTDLSDIGEQLTREMGKPWPESMGEMANCASAFRYFAEMARDEAGKVAGTTQTGSFQFARYEALGVTVHIMPFNFPLLLMCWTVAASLAAGNACVIKPAPVTTLSTLAFMRCFAALPPGLIACLPGGIDLATYLIESPLTHAVAFTGSAAAARQVGALAGAHLKPAILEGGGSDPFVVSAHAPIDVAAAGAVTAAFHLSGQVCTSAERFYVVDDVHDAFVDAMVRKTRQLRVGHGMGHHEIGPLVSEAARNRVMALIDDARQQGASVVCGGQIPPDAGPGWFLEPTILTNVTASMKIVRDECFGPVAAITRVPDFATALRLANDTPFGLGASVFTTRLDEALDAAEVLEAGMVWVNNPLIDNDALPFGGWKASGMGRELSRVGLDSFRRAKMVVIDHKPAIQDWWYPYPDSWFRDGSGRSAT